MDMRALIARMDAIEEANKPADNSETPKPSTTSTEPDSDGDRSKGDAPIINRDWEKDGTPGLNNTPDSDGDRSKGDAPIVNRDWEKDGTLGLNNPANEPQAADDKTKAAQDATDQLDKDSGQPAQPEGAPDPTDVSRFADLLMKCKDSGWRVPINPATVQQAVQSAEKLSEAFLIENPAIFRLLTAPAMTGRLRSAFLQSLGMSKKLRMQLYKMNPQAFKTGNFTAQQKQLIQNYTNKTQSSGRITRSNVRQTAQNLRDDPRIAQDLTRASQGGLWSTLSKVATIGTLGWLGYEAYKALFGGEEELSPGGGMDGAQSTKPGAASPGAASPGAAGQTQPCLNPQEIADLDKMSASWEKVNDPSIKALVAAWSAVKPIMTKTTESKGSPMNMKNLIAQMDAIEKGKKYISESAAPVVEYKGGTDAEKIKNWQKHIDQFKEKGMYKAADDAEKSAKRAQPGFKPARSTDKPAKEGMGSIARALMQDMGIDEEGDYDAATKPPPGTAYYGDPNVGGIKGIGKAFKQAFSGQGPTGYYDAQGNMVPKANPNAVSKQQYDASVDSVDAAAGTPVNNPLPTGMTQAQVDQARNATEFDVADPASDPNTNPGATPNPAAPSVGDAAAMDTPQMAQQAAAVAAGAPQPGPQPGTGDANVAQAAAQPAAQPDPSKKWPTSPDEIRAFQRANKLTPDAFIGKNTLDALLKQGYKPPQGFQMVKDKATGSGQGAMPAPTATQASVRSIDNATVGVNMSRPPKGQGYSKTKVKPRPAAKPEQWDYDYGKTHNADGSPKALNPAAAAIAAGQATEAISEDDRILNMIRGIKF